MVNERDFLKYTPRAVQEIRHFELNVCYQNTSSRRARCLRLRSKIHTIQLSNITVSYILDDAPLISPKVCSDLPVLQKMTHAASLWGTPLGRFYVASHDHGSASVVRAIYQLSASVKDKVKVHSHSLRSNGRWPISFSYGRGPAGGNHQKSWTCGQHIAGPAVDFAIFTSNPTLAILIATNLPTLENGWLGLPASRAPGSNPGCRIACPTR